MKEKSELLLLFFVLNYIASLQVGLNEDEKEPQKIKIGSKVEYDKNNNYFSFQYEGSNAALIVKFIDKFGIEIILKNSKYKKIELNKIVGVYIGNLTKADTYYLEINCSSICCEIGGKFETSLYGDILETIDLNENIYYQDFEIYSTESFYGNIKYKVSGLKEDKYVFFKVLEDYDTNYYYPYYPNESIVTDDLDSPDFSNLTIFEVTNISSGNSERNLNVYHFVKNTEYIINIHCLKSYSSYDSGFRYIQFFFIPITNSSIRRFQGDEGIITSEVPIHGIVESDNVKEFYIFCNYDINNYNKIYWVNTSKPIKTFEQYLEILPKLQPISVSNLHFQEEKTENTVILLLPESYEYKSRLYLVELFDDTCGKDFTLPANTNKIINCKRDEEDKIDTFWTKEIFYPVITLTSKYKNMRYLFSEYDNNTDYIIHNHFFQPIYLEKTEKDCDIIFKKYSPNFAFFAVGNPFLYNSFYNIFQRLLNNEYGININNYTKLPQVYLRVSSYHLGIIDFFNFYLSQLHIKINVYIRQLYGGTDLYECDGDGDGDGYDIKNLDSFANPISNVKCKNKISLFNRLFNLEGTKFLAGYIAPDSYFDIYAEINDNTSEVINLFPIYRNNICSRNTAKYLKKGVKYKINFDLDHMIKLEPGFDAKIRITNELVNKIIIINPQNPTSPISGTGYTIESNNDAMIYFIEKLPDGYNQMEIDRSAGKIIEIIYKEKRGSYIIDLGFEKYCHSNSPLIGDIEGIYSYLDNIYDKIKGKLVNGEKLYIYSKNFEHIQEIHYTGKNLNNKNNNFNIFLIPKNDEVNSLVVKTRNKGYNKIIFDLFFCKRDTILQIKILNWDNNNNTCLTITNNNFTEDVREYKVDKNSDDYKMLFETDQPVVFTYSYIDSIDEIYEGNDDYKKEREVIRNPKIEEIVRKNGNEIKIKFKPNYKHSSTRYIILIAQKNSENTIEKFKDPCFVTGLLNQRPNGVKVEAIYDGGIDDSINAEVDISDILNEKNSYLMSIISQELRFFKKINFYEPKEFGSEEDSSILVIILPIVGAIIIVIVAIVVFFIIRRKHNKQDDVPENFDAVSKLSKLSDKSFQF